MADPYAAFSSPISASPGAPDPYAAVASPTAVRLYSPNPDAPTSYGGPDVPLPSTTGTDVARVIGQGAQNANDAMVTAAAAPFDLSAWLSRKLGLVPENTPRPSDVAKQGIDYLATAPGRVGDAISTGSTAPLTDSRTSRFEPQTEAERIAGDIGNAAGTVFGTMIPGSALLRMAAPGSRVAKVAAGTMTDPVKQTVALTAGNTAGRESDNPYVGLAATAAMPFAMGGAARLASAAPAVTTQEAERRALLQFGRDNDLGPLTAGKILDSRKLQAAESTVSKLPLPGVGGRTEATENAARDAWQGAILRTAGIQGETAATKNVTDLAFGRLSNQFENLTKGRTISVTPKFGQDLSAIKSEYGDRLFEDVQPGLMKRIDSLSQAPAALAGTGNPAVTLDGRTYQNIRSDLSRIAGTASKSADRRAAGMMVNALDDMAAQSLPAEVMDGFNTARRQWRNLLAIRGAVKGANNAQTAVGNIPTAGFARRASGNPDLDRLAQYGNKFIGDKVPNSGTPERMALTHMLGLGAGAYEGMQHAPMTTMAAGGAAAIPYAFDMALNNPATRALLMRRYANPSSSILTPGLLGTLAGQSAAKQPR